MSTMGTSAMMFDWSDRRFINAFSGALAGVFTAAFVCPLDVLKTRMQVQDLGNPRYTGVVGGLSTLVREEGLRAAYRGLQPTVLALLPTWGLYFTTYEFLKKHIKSSSSGKHLSPTMQYIGASVGAGALNVTVTNPLWVVKTRLQTQSMPAHYRVASSYTTNYKGTYDALRTMARTEGLRGMYSGLMPSLVGIAHVGIQFPLYEELKSRAAKVRGRDSDNLAPTDLIVLSSAAKMVASTATYPHEVIRSQLHVSQSGTVGMGGICARIMRTEGFRGFYRGCFTNLIRTTPAAAITFTSYELISRNLAMFAKALKERQARDLRETSAQEQVTS